MNFFYTPTPPEEKTMKFLDANLIRYFLGGTATGVVEAILTSNGNWFDIARVGATSLAFSVFFKWIEFLKFEIDKCRGIEEEPTQSLLPRMNIT